MTEPTNLVKTQPDETATYTVKANGGHRDFLTYAVEHVKLSATTSTSCHIGITIKPDKDIPSGHVWAWISYYDDAGHGNFANSSRISYVIPAGVWTRLEWTVTVPAGMIVRQSAISIDDLADETNFHATNYVVYPLTGGRIVRARGATALVSVNDGAKGDQGIPGKDGKSPTVSVSKSGTVTTIVVTNADGSKTTQTVNDGVNGTPGAKGADGRTTYFHVKYSNDGGKTFTANSGETVGTYIGTCTDYNSADPTTVGSYTWARIKGDTGATGAAGTSYWVSHEWIDVSASTYDQDTYYPVVGSGIPRNGTHRIKTSVQLNSGTKPKWSMHNAGFSVDLDIQTQASGWGTTHAVTYILLDDYDWCVSGAPSPVSFVQKSEASVPVLYLRGGGKYYVETTYSCSWSIKTSEYYTYQQGTTKKGPVSPTKTRPAVEGKPIKGDKGDKGDTGATGTGVTSIVEQYYLSTSSSTQAGGTWQSAQPEWSSGHYIWTRSHITWTNGTTSDTTPVLANGLNSANQVASSAQSSANETAGNFAEFADQYNQDKAISDQDIKNASDAAKTAQSAADAAKEAAYHMQELINAMQKAVDDYQTLRKLYMDFSEDTSKGLIIGGRNADGSDNAFKTQITNTAMNFVMFDDVIAYISNQMFQINRGVVREWLRVGNFVLMSEDGNFNIKYQPDTAG